MVQVQSLLSMIAKISVLGPIRSYSHYLRRAQGRFSINYLTMTIPLDGSNTFTFSYREMPTGQRLNTLQVLESLQLVHSQCMQMQNILHCIAVKCYCFYGIHQWTDLEKDKKITRQSSESLHIAMAFT